MRKSVFVRSAWLLLVTAIFLAAPALGRTQGQLAADVDLKKAFNASSDQLRALYSGEQAATKADKKHAEAAAQWYLYRLTIKAYLTEAPTPIAPNGAQKLQKEFHDKVTDIMYKNAVGKNGEFRKLFAAALVSSMKNVLADRDLKTDPTTIIHAVEMLPDMARLKQDEISNYLCELAKDAKNPVLQLHALKALKETMPIAIQPDPEDFAGVNAYNARKVRDVKNVDALRQYIERPVNTAGMSPEEYKAVIFIRREAIIALAQAGAPAVIATPNKKMVQPPEGAAAHTLLNVLAGNLQRPPTLQEKVEAALGLCSMKYPNMPEYEPQLGIYLIGKTLDEFVAEYSTDWVNFAKVGAGKKLPHMAFAGDARRWKAGLKELSANTPNPTGKAARELEAATTPILDKIMGKSDASKYGSLTPLDVNTLKTLLPQWRPKTGYIFKTLKMQEIPLGK
jgi:hypothetical protein